jgi:hypothetical protein
MSCSRPAPAKSLRSPAPGGTEASAIVALLPPGNLGVGDLVAACVGLSPPLADYSIGGIEIDGPRGNPTAANDRCLSAGPCHSKMR